MPHHAEPGESDVAVIDDRCEARAEPRAPLAAVIALVRAATDGAMPDAARVRLRRFLAARIHAS